MIHTKKFSALLCVILCVLCVSLPWKSSAASKPNIIFMMLDDAGVGDLGCYGSTHIRTPNIDRIAEEGMRFTNAYSGSAVCAPTRCVLMTGLHSGHCRRRDNTAKAHLDDFPDRPLVFLEPEDLTVASFLKSQGYVCGGYGKWGLGNPGSTGVPENHGFDDFYGYYDQVHAHTYYPEYLVRNSEEIPLPGNREGKEEQYTHDILFEAALEFVKENRENPFFLYLPFTIPHAKYQIPDLGDYADKDWTEQGKVHAAMMTRLDADVGRLMALLQESGIDEETVVFFTSDNGVNRGKFAERFDSAMGLRGFKRDLYEGGIRAPMIVRWPGAVEAGAVSDFAWCHRDFFRTAAQIAGAEAPAHLDGISVLPTLRGEAQDSRAHLYWEIHSPFQQAVRMGKWKGIRFGTEAKLELYDLDGDEGEKMDVAAAHPEIVSKIEKIMAVERTENKYFPEVKLPAPKRGKKKK